MGNGSRQFTHRCDSTEMAELFTVVQCFQFSLFSSRNVDADSENTIRFLVGIEMHAPTRCHPTHNSIRQNEPILTVVIRPILDCVVDYLSNAMLIVWMYAFGPAIPQFLLQAPPGKLEPRFVKESAEFVHTRHPD